MSFTLKYRKQKLININVSLYWIVKQKINQHTKLQTPRQNQAWTSKKGHGQIRHWLFENLVRRMHRKEVKNAPALTAACQHHHLFILSCCVIRQTHLYKITLPGQLSEDNAQRVGGGGVTPSWRWREGMREGEKITHCSLVIFFCLV